VVAIAKHATPGCAKVMAQSAIYGAFPLLEGLGLMSLEAMTSGCHVVGYVGGGEIESRKHATCFSQKHITDMSKMES